MSKGNRKNCVFVKVSCKHAHTSNTVTELYIQPDSVKFYHGHIVVVCTIHTVVQNGCYVLNLGVMQHMRLGSRKTFLQGRSEHFS